MIGTIHINKKNESIYLKYLLWLLLLLAFGILLSYTTQDLNPFQNKNHRNSTENTNHSVNGSNNNNIDKIKIQEDRKMHQLGKHFNKHGRGMGYQSKTEYNKAAIEFAKSNRTNSNAKIIEGTWSGSGKFTAQNRQIAISYKNRTVVLDKISGQLIDFFEGSELRGLIDILRLQ